MPGQLEPAPYPTAAMQEFGTLDSLIERARRNNRTLQVTQSDIRVSEREVEAADSAFYPKVNLEFGASRNRNADGTRGDDNDASALVVMRWNLYRGGSDIAQRRVALGRMSQTIAQHHVAARATEEEVRRAWILLQAAEARIPVLAAAVEKNIRVRDTYATQFLTRDRSLIDVLNAENELFVSNGRLVSAETARVAAAYRLLAATAELVRALDIGDVVSTDPAQPPAGQCRRPVDRHRAERDPALDPRPRHAVDPRHEEPVETLAGAVTRIEADRRRQIAWGLARIAILERDGGRPPFEDLGHVALQMIRDEDPVRTHRHERPVQPIRNEQPEVAIPEIPLAV
jgi:hypothetical protein